MKNIMIIQYPSISHLNGAFKIANILKDQGYEITYFIDDAMAHHVLANGFKYLTANSIPIIEKFDRLAMKRLNVEYGYFDEFLYGIISLYFEFRREELTNAIDFIKPSIIIADTFAGSDFSILYPVIKQRNIKFFYLETMLSSIETKGIPYLTSRAAPYQRIKILTEYYKKRVFKTIYRSWRKIILLGYDNYSQLQKNIKEQKIPNQYVIDYNNHIDIAFTNISTLIAAPIELEFFPTPQHPLRHYLGFFTNKKSNNILLDDRLKNLLNTEKKIIYISFGTVFGDRKFKIIQNFMIRLNAALKGYDDVTAIFSLGKAQWSNKQRSMLNHINIFNYVPQAYLLSHCSLFITHGGLNSIKESIEDEVPMLIYALDIDQKGNASKIFNKDLGLKGEIKRDRVNDIRDKIDKLLYDKKFKDNLRDFKQTIASNYDIEKQVIEIINNEGVIV